MKCDPNAPVYPIDEGYEIIANAGLTKREWFAGLAMQGLLSNPNLTTIMAEAAKIEGHGKPQKIYARLAVEDADALIAELNKAKTK